MPLCLNCLWSTPIPSSTACNIHRVTSTPKSRWWLWIISAVTLSGHSASQKTQLIATSINDFPPCTSPSVRPVVSYSLLRPTSSTVVPAYTSYFPVLHLTPWLISAEILLCSPTPTMIYHLDCGDTWWNRMGWTNTTTVVFKYWCFFLAQERKEFGISLSLFQAWCYNAKSEWSKMNSTCFPWRWEGRSTVQNICSLHCPLRGGLLPFLPG